MGWWCGTVMVFWAIILLNILPGNSISPCRDSGESWRSWCERSNTCQTYPHKQGSEIYTNCKKTCKICQSDTLCGDGYYGPQCKPCVNRCNGRQCETARSGECQQTCQDGKHGLKCDKTCPRNCVACDRWSDDCTECGKEWYGATCSSRCPDNCVDGVCEIETGECVYGCEPMWEGDRCETKTQLCENCNRHDCLADGICLSGCKDNKWHGPKCDDKCSSNCRSKVCSNDTGHCLKGCKTGYYGPFCSNSCSDNCENRKCDHSGRCNQCVTGRYSDDCARVCSSNCNGSCYRRTGRCRNCVVGWYGPNCRKSCGNCVNGCERKGICNAGCHPGYYGSKCDKKCSQNCKGRQCNQTTGDCTGGCKDSWYGKHCRNKCISNCNKSLCAEDTLGELECVDGCKDSFYGKYCSSKCSSNCIKSLCAEDALRGLECLDGCIGGMKGQYCEERCPSHCVNCTEDSCLVCEEGYYGVSCELSCPVNCNGGCYKDSGQCSSCKHGFYGSQCQSTCSAGCKTPSLSSEVCKFDSGACQSGCNDGLYGANCNQSCSDTCKYNQCRQNDGSCTDGCVDGWKGPQCTIPCASNCQICNDVTCTECKSTWFDLTSECDKKCSRFCLHSTCDSHGRCENGCMEGFFGSKCNLTCVDDNCLKCERDSGQCLECKPTWYGSTCDQSCPNCAEGNCSLKSGDCREGCLASFHGSHCDIKCNPYCKMKDINKLVYCKQETGKCVDGCSVGHYGDTCDQPCSDTCNGYVCDQTSGRCNYGCQSGRYGDFCKQNCSDRCAREQCHQTDGSCVDCQRGWHGPHCNDACPDGCLDGLCNQESGICKEGCKQGFMGDRCDNACLDYQFGYNCNENCGHCKNNATCDRFYGNCSTGCAVGFGGELCAQPLIIVDTDTNEPTASATLPIVLAVVAILLIAVLFVVGFLMYKRRQAIVAERKKDKEYLMLPMSSNVVSNPTYSHSPAAPCKPLRTTPKKNGVVGSLNGHTAMADIHQEEDENDDDAYYNLITKNSVTMVKTADLWSHVQQLKIGGTFQEQYDSLPTGLIHTCNVAMLPENKGKNRYKNICAFDRSRVVLDAEDGDPHSHYINANYVSGYQRPKMFVASQGPVDVILNDFWRMIWQLNTSKIVMLTNLVEEGRMKCVMYWPEHNSGPVQYGSMVVECTTEDVLAHYTIRTLKMCKLKQGKSKASNPRIVKHFHFTSWPDKGVPTDVASLVEFYFKVMSTPTHGQGPMVVHCSAGIGRTGTFLSLAYLIDEAKATETVDPFRCIQRMRHERVNMVQTEEQYEFLHLALVEALMAAGTTVPTANFQTYYHDLLTANPDSGVIKIKELFETLNLMTPPYRLEEYQTAMMPENISKNRFKDILASDYHRPFLSTPIHGRTDYINAVFLPAYKQKRAFILTQMPMQDTVIDFWRLMFESYSQTIVMLNDDHDDQLTVGYYWPQKNLGREMYGPYFVEVDDEEDYECYRVLTLKVTKPSADSEQNDCQRTIKLFQCHFWPHGQIIPDSAIPMFAVMDAVDVWQQKTDQAQITVHCLDGVERSGLFCVLSAILERLKIEQDVSILQTINQMRACRPQLIQSFNQFKFLYSAVNEYLDTFATYSNFT